ncbi:MAG TPA: 4-hydroxy-3-methylbut-2-enyl diphosphate reductase [Acidimicrobiia bacterium]|jgi:4-hydroxy-3-methylbut-2-enyl diphosphate reductase
MRADRVLLIEPRGFCAGVEAAVKALAWMVVLHPPPVYCVHEVVHNRTVARRFRDLGVVFVGDVTDVPQGATVMLSAHGTAPRAAARVAREAAVVVDAVCPLVAKVHQEMRVRAQFGYDLVYVGHDGHDETVGALGVRPGDVRLVESARDVDGIVWDDTRPVALLAQTTLAVDEWRAVERAVRARAGQVWTPQRADICYATTNRQQAVRDVAGSCDAMVVVGSDTSANTRALTDVAERAGCPVVVRVDDADELPAVSVGRVGVTSGASAPEDALCRVVDRLAVGATVETVSARTEDEFFPLPPPIRRAVKAALRAGAIPPQLRWAAADDRAVSAADLLDAVADLVNGRARGSPGVAPSVMSPVS